ncbi:helix-turn-helix domain-containing protein [Paenibacillus alvei]|uniref:Helix-turn-helix transcriptional regulator n=1 Tax=Paenibacillus alvei TaxID=44250 RepID=A0AAP7DK11_PAEAL|nr:helix-turn-helix transcriptional regulator [Paenibacillus alvei]NOJ72445.1 helix-turn-helix transcriptional regulator [Paenibacillus alvei]
MDTIQKIEVLMKQRNMTKYKLAKESGLPQSTITSLMSGRIKNPSLETLTKISNALEVPISHFLDDPITRFLEEGYHENPPVVQDEMSEIDEDVRALAREIQDLNSGDKKLLKDMINSMRERGREARKK